MIVSLKADGYKALFADANKFLQLSGKDEILAEVKVKHGRGTDFVTAMAEKTVRFFVSALA